MKRITMNVEKFLCGDCSMALRRFIGNIEGVEDIDVGQGTISMQFDETRIPEERLFDITKNSVEKLGYRLEE